MVFGVDSINLRDEIIPKDMVYMAMGIQVADKSQVVVRDKTPDFLLFRRLITGGIDQNTFTGLIVQNIGVYHEGVEDKFLDNDHVFIC